MWIRLFLFFVIISCATGTSDPLKNSKKLIKEGHASLYQNGAFAIPQTKIKLIPPGPDAIELAKELSGIKAKESFLQYVNEVKSSAIQIYTGSKRTFRFAGKVDKNLSKEISEIVPKLRENSVVIMNRSFALSKEIIGESVKLGDQAKIEQINIGKEIVQKSRDIELKQERFNGTNEFIVAYVKLPEVLKERAGGIKKSSDLNKFVEAFKDSNEVRKDYSKDSVYLIKDSFKNYASEVSDSFSQAKSEFGKSDKYGVTLPLIESVAWLIDGILWQGLVKPLGKLTAGAIGYAFVNGIAYPTYLVTSEGITTTLMAVEVSKETAHGIYNIIAPTAEYAVSAILYSGEFFFKELTRNTVKGAGFIVGNSLEYVGAPITKTIAVGGGALTGVAVGVGGGVLAGSVRASGELMSISGNVISKTAAASVVAGGVIAHTLKGTGEVVYEVTKASVVPPGLVLGSGLTLSYGTVSQLSAQSVLAVSDAAYLVLSMEGPKWVVYAIQGKTLDDVPSNTIINLNRMQDKGEIIQRVPLTDEETVKVLESLNNYSEDSFQLVCTDEYSKENFVHDDGLELIIELEKSGRLSAQIAGLGYARRILRTLVLEHYFVDDHGSMIFTGDGFKFQIDSKNKGNLSVKLENPSSFGSSKVPVTQVNEKMACYKMLKNQND